MKLKTVIPTITAMAILGGAPAYAGVYDWSAGLSKGQTPEEKT